MSSNIKCDDKYHEWLRIEYIGKDKKQHFNYGNTHTDMHWVFSPSGRICTHWSTIYGESGYVYIFTFIDLVEKVNFEARITYWFNSGQEAIDIINIYFSAEDELVLISASDTFSTVKLIVYELDYVKQTLELKETIAPNCNERTNDCRFRAYQNMFVVCDGIEYVVLISYPTILLVPKNPREKNTHVREYRIDRFDYAKTNYEMKHYLESNGVADFGFELDEACVFVNGTKLFFGTSLKRFRGAHTSHSFHLVGAYWTVDMSKLKDISLKSNGDMVQLMKDQVDVCKFVTYENLYLAEKIHFCYFEEKIGLFYMFQGRNEGDNADSVALLYPSNAVDTNKSVTLDCKICNIHRVHTLTSQFSLHPQGALLEIEIGEKEIASKIRVIKLLKHSLWSIAFNNSLFNKNISMREADAYKLCFTGTNCITHEKLIVKKNLKREHTDNE